MDRQLHHRLNAGEADDACMIGEDPRTGFRVVIGQQKVAARRELSGKAVIWITPDEVAAVLANLEAFKPIAVVKTLFPGAEILDVRRGGGGGPMKRAAVLATSTRREISVPINQKNQTAIKMMKSHKYSNFGAQNLCRFPK